MKKKLIDNRPYCCTNQIRLGSAEPKVELVTQRGSCFIREDLFFRILGSKKFPGLRSVQGKACLGVTHELDLNMFAQKATADQAEILINSCGELNTLIESAICGANERKKR